jgi:hypothetical protein
LPTETAVAALILKSCATGSAAPPPMLTEPRLIGPPSASRIKACCKVIGAWMLIPVGPLVVIDTAPPSEVGPVT